jgi:sortase A
MQKKNNLSTILLVIMLLAGLSLLLYPTFSNWWNSRVSSYAVTNYIEQISNLDSDQYKEIWDDAAAHNASLLDRSNPFLLSMEQETNYYQLLDVGGTGIMGYIEIPSLQVTLPLYHGTSESVLQVAVGHLEWTSLPVGGESTHCVLSGHRGLPSARLFTDLDKMMVGDLFMLHILDETLTYEVDQILIVYPEETEDLMIQEGKDLVTLVTCTPYGINTHRILVRGHRVDNIEAAQVVRVTADALVVEKLLVAPFLLAPLLLVLLIVALIPSRNKD